MHDELLPQTERFKRSHRRKRNWRKVVISLACAVVFITTYMLILPAITMEKTAYCGMEEHQHSEDCYEDVLICTQDHTHTQDCYEKNLICEIPEHAHVLVCYSDPEADIEGEEAWKQSVSEVKLTGIRSEDVIAVAESQLDYEESDKNYTVVNEDTIKGITRYGQWYGDDYGDWSAMFVSFCLYFANIPEYDVPYEKDCEIWVKKLTESGIYNSADDYIPQKGDIIFFDDDGDGTADSAGLVSGLDENGKNIQVIEGDSSDSVKSNKYKLSNDKIIGYAEIEQTDGEALVSTDAVTLSGSMSEVYLNGSSGSDLNSGASSSPVKTFEKAQSLLSEGGTIYISGTVTVSTDQSWSLDNNGSQIKRYSSFTGPLVSVASGGTLSLSDVTINGGSGTPSASSIATNTTYATSSAKAPLIVVQSGGSLSISDGAVLQYNSNKPDTKSTGVFSENGYVGQGGAVYSDGGTIVMDGGLIQYCEAHSGGGIYIENGSFTLTGGTIDKNYARDILTGSKRHSYYGYRNAGGGVYVGDNSTMEMYGGVISNNQSSREGGGISLGWLDRVRGHYVSSYITTFKMSGGTLTGNTATSTGGGLNITAGRRGIISAGYITNNTANGREYQYEISGTVAYQNVFSGGGIYVDASQWNSSGSHAGVSGYLEIHRVIVTDNTATTYGGGLACCNTSNTNIGYTEFGNGTAFYGNSAGTAGNELAFNGGPSFTVSSTMLGGGSYNWSISTSGYYRVYNNSLTDTSASVQTAQTLATVYITGNTGYIGGGIGINGIIMGGGETDSGDTSISITKVWDDNGASHPDYITVQVLRNGVAYGDPIRIYKVVDSNGNETWPTYYLDGLDSSYTYTIEEVTVPGYDSTITSDGNSFTITNTLTGFRVIKNWIGDTASDRPVSIKVQLYQNSTAYGDVVELNEGNGWSYMWSQLPEKGADGIEYTYTAVETEIPDGYYCSDSGHLNENGEWEITNSKIERTDVSAEKRWAAGTDPAQSITLQLLADGKPYGNEVTLSSANGWFYKWDNLPVYTAENAPDGEKIVYTVTETNALGYKVTVNTADASDAKKAWTVASTPESGKTYLFVSSDGALAGSGSSQLKWLDVSSQLSDGSLPEGAALWTYSGGTLQNGDGYYLYLQSSGSWLSRTYTYILSSSGTSISFNSGGNIYASGGLSSRYLSGISDGSGTTTTSSSSAVSFTLYEQTDTSADWGNTHFIVTNEKAPDTLSVCINKYSITGSRDNPMPISGAELALYRKEESDTVIPNTNVTGTLIASWTSGSVESGDEVRIEALTDGTYYLVETQAPVGHYGLNSPIIFVVDTSAGTITVTRYQGFEDLQGELTEGENGFDLPVYNQATYTLPETGGTGTFWITAGGLVLISVSLLIGCVMRRRKERRFN